MASGLTILCAARLHKNQLERHLELFEHVPEVARVIVVRHESTGETFPKVESRIFRSGSRPLRALRMAREIRTVISQERVDRIIGFNPVPWGAVAYGAASGTGIPRIMSLIGRDFLQVQSWWGRGFLEVLRRADAVTVTGQKMVEGLVEKGVERERLWVLPHSVDTARFVPRVAPPKYDLVAVGQLIQRKRMDVLIDAVALLAERGLRLKVGILGKGPLDEPLRAQVQQKSIGDLVEFLEYRDDVETVLRASKLFCLVSEWEGLPFALMEAMAVGLVPVVTDVGTISDWVHDGVNGALVPVGDPAALASRIEGLLSNQEAEYTRCHQRLLAQRERLSFVEGARIWRDVLAASDT
jgi:glycosyltransferase involved in cell wall biosynthesis